MKSLKFLFLIWFFALNTSAAVVPHQTEVNNDAPIFFYRFGETSGASVNDDSVNNRDASFAIGGFTRNANTLLFNQGTTDKSVTVADATLSGAVGSFSTTTGFSASLSVNFTTVETGAPHRFLEVGFQGSSGFGWHYLRYDPSSDEIRLGYNFANGTIAANADATWLPVAGRTYQLSVSQVYSTGVTKFFVDGFKIAEIAASANITPLANSRPTMLVGVNATVDEMAFFGTPLSETRVKAQFASSRAADLATNVYYASPTGTIYGRGTTSDPLELQTLLNFGLLQPGGIGYLQAGNYTGVYRIDLSGTSGGRITFRPNGNVRVTLNGAGLQGDVIRANGSWLDVGFLIIRKTWAIRTDTTYTAPGDNSIEGTNGTTGGVGVFDAGDNNRFYHCVIHDVLGDGIDSFREAENPLYYGNLTFNNGWFAPRRQIDADNGFAEPNGHGIYTQNNQPSTKTIRGNLFINDYGSPVKISGSGEAATDNYILEENVTLNGGYFNNIGGSDNGVRNLIYRRNRTYNGDWHIGYNTATSTTAEIVDSIFHGYDWALTLSDFNSFTVTGNSIIGQPTTSGGAGRYRIRTGNAYNASTVNNNNYFRNTTSPELFNYNNQTSVAYIGANFTNYKSATGWDTASIFTDNGTNNNKPPTNQVIVQPLNQFEPCRGYVVVYNWQNLSTVSVNLSTILSGCGAYEIRSATNYFANAVVTGTGSGSSVSLPLTIAAGLPARALPYGDIARNPESAPNFAAFIIQPVTSGGTGGGTLTTINHFFNTP